MNTAVNREIADANNVYATLDLGSNSFHLIIARDVNSSLQIIDRYKETVRLAEGLSETKEISKPAMQRACACLSRIAQRLRSLPKHNIRVVGTAAIREATNRSEFIKQAEECLDQPIEVISGLEEARLIHLATSHFHESRDNPRLVVDIGGASTELIQGFPFRPRIRESLKMGCVLLSEIYFAKGQITKSSMKSAIQHCKQELEVVETVFSAEGWDEVIGTSGTITAILKAVKSIQPRATEITAESLANLRQEMVSKGDMAKLAHLQVSKTRTPVFPGGFAVLAAVFEALAIKKMYVSGDSLREGLLHDMLGRVHEDDIREQTVQSLMTRFHVDDIHAKQVASTALALFNQISEAWDLHQEDDANLLRWGALLHEVGMNISHSSYHKHGEYLLNNLDMPGFSMTDQQLLGLLVRTHRRNYPALDLTASDHISKLAALLRIAVLLHRNRSVETLPVPTISLLPNGLRLNVSKSWLSEHPLTKLDFEQEVNLLAQSPIDLQVEETN